MNLQGTLRFIQAHCDGAAKYFCICTKPPTGMHVLLGRNSIRRTVHGNLQTFLYLFEFIFSHSSVKRNERSTPYIFYYHSSLVDDINNGVRGSFQRKERYINEIGIMRILFWCLPSSGKLRNKQYGKDMLKIFQSYTTIQIRFLRDSFIFD